MPELKTPSDWAKEQGVVILDADGWNDGKPFTDPVTAEEFARRLEQCTAERPVSPELVESATIRCQDCPASWLLIEKPAPCFAQGHRAELNGVPVEYSPALNGFGR